MTARRVRLRTGMLAALSALALTVAGCADNTGSDGSFDFVAPGGQTTIFYDPPADRDTIGDISGPDLMNEGEDIGLEDFTDQVVVLNLWGQWCGPCRGEVPELEKVAEETWDQGVRLLGINVRDHQRSAAQDFVRTNELTYPSIYDPAMRTVIALGSFPTSVVPSTLVLDRDHRVAAVFLKPLSAEELQPVVERIAAESNDTGSAG